MQRNLGTALLLTINVDSHRKAANLILKRPPRHHLQQGPWPPLPQQCTSRLIRQQEGLRRLGGGCELLPLVQARLESTPVLALRLRHQRLAPPVQRRRATLRLQTRGNRIPGGALRAGGK